MSNDDICGQAELIPIGRMWEEKAWMTFCRTVMGHKVSSLSVNYLSLVKSRRKKQ